MIHLLPTILSTQATCGVDVPVNAEPSLMPAHVNNVLDPEVYCVRCFELYSRDQRTKKLNRGPAFSPGGYPFDAGEAN